MTARTDIDDEEAAAIWAYLRTVPALRNPLPPPPPLPPETQADAGSAVYYKYGCNVCHGDDGSAPHDLRGARARSSRRTTRSSTGSGTPSARGPASRCRPGTG